jgi:hypothetical protein
MAPKIKSKYKNKYFSVEKTKKIQVRYSDDLRRWKLQGKTESQAYAAFSQEAKEIDNRARRGVFRAIWNAFEPKIRVQVVTIDGRPINRGKSYGEVVSEVLFYAGPRELTDVDVGELIAPMTLRDKINKYGLLRSGSKNRIDWEAAFHSRTISSMSQSDRDKIVYSKGEIVERITDLIVSNADTYKQGGHERSRKSPSTTQVTLS